MIKANWSDLLPSSEQIQAMSSEQLVKSGAACSKYSITLGHGISSIGYLLASTADSDTGLSRDAAIELGWLLEALGELSARLVDTGQEIADRSAT